MNKTPFVTCQIYGQIGNQLFQIAATLAFAWDHGAIPLFPALHNPAWNISYNKDRLFSKLNASSLPRNIFALHKEKGWSSYEKIPFQKDLLLDGYFQSFKYFDHRREEILQSFAPSDFTQSYLQAKYQDLLNRHTVGIHVRTQCKRTHENGHHPFWGMDYYFQAMELFPKNSLFLIFSDRIEWCKRHFPKENSLFIEGNYGIEDLFFLSKCNDLILCNSSFSWWAAYLHEKKGKIFFPKYWKNPTMHENPHPDDFFLKEWTLLNCDPTLPFPKDMYAYDKTSQCLDNND